MTTKTPKKAVAPKSVSKSKTNASKTKSPPITPATKSANAPKTTISSTQNKPKAASSSTKTAAVITKTDTVTGQSYSSTSHTTNTSHIITGNWQDTDTAGGRGKWWYNNNNCKGLYQPSNAGNSVDLYLDNNRNGRIDQADTYVGYATSASTSTGGHGTWEWNTDLGSGSYYGSQGQRIEGVFAFTSPAAVNC